MGKGGGSSEVKETSQERELAMISNEQWGQYQSRFVPFENEWIKDIPVTYSEKARATGQTAGEAGLQSGQLRQGIMQSQMNRGINPNSGQFQGALSSAANKGGIASGRAQIGVNQAMGDQYYQGLQSAINIGRGQAGEAMQDTASLAKGATNTAISDAYAKQNSADSIKSSAASIAGMGLSAWNNTKVPTIEADKVKVKYP
jgi:hypothetical protein